MPSASGPILITGGVKRLGREIALSLFASGYDLILHGRELAAVPAHSFPVTQTSGKSVHYVQADLGDGDQVVAMAQQIERDFGTLGGLINNAALFESDDLLTLDAQSFAKHQSVNVLAPLLLIQNLRSALIRGRGTVINILDHNIENPNIDFLSYKLSKFAMAGATQILARQLAPDIRVNAIAPGLTLPSSLQSGEAFESVHNDVPLQRGSQPADIAQAVKYLLSAKAVTGQVLFVDGGERFLARLRDVSIARPVGSGW
jgi:NAD(P)-dependent dehydrogenase (short-subunit alcohol dehydrogenase family)